MPSLAAHLLDPFLRFQVKRKLKRASDARQLRQVLGRPMPAPRGIRYMEAILGVRGEWAEGMASPAAVMTLLYLHGGAYIACSPRTHRPITGGFAARHIRVFAPDYRLAPEHPFPAAVDDGLAAYEALLDLGNPPERLAIAGDSSGGGLALAVMLAAKAKGLPMPARCVLFSPWTDLAATGESLHGNSRRDPMIDGSRISEGAAAYLNGADPRDPLASPLYADLAGLPPMLIYAGEREVLLDDSVRLDANMRKAGVPSQLRVWPVVPHAWPLYQAFLPEGRHALDESAAFIRGAASAG
ncbi:MAG TPA: alpha/beta hydrolase [Acetobacteraceae bacterium]|nr:alpha/beta hydrolase [Acetobacteraceae bacterium]